MEPVSWLTAISSLVIGLFGGGGIAAFIKARADRKQGISQQEIAKDDAIAHRWQEIAKTQAETLVAPLRTSVHELEEKADKLEIELADSRRKYWSAISYIRTLLTWIARHTPDHDDVERTQVPDPPVIVIEDL